MLILVILTVSDQHQSARYLPASVWSWHVLCFVRRDFCVFSVHILQAYEINVYCWMKEEASFPGLSASQWSVREWGDVWNLQSDLTDLNSVYFSNKTQYQKEQWNHEVFFLLSSLGSDSVMTFYSCEVKFSHCSAVRLFLCPHEEWRRMLSSQQNTRPGDIE